LTTLDRILDIAHKAAQVVDIFAPGLGIGVNAGVAVAQDLVTKWNAAHPAEQVVLPPTPELIERLAATSTRVVDRSLAFLAGGDTAGTSSKSSMGDATGEP
jgi:hypothetical protein